ncbi:hypothetical protein FA15DRAFT_620133 [Coprinopsis marcescibilis]|uniref:PH domain-containing protein n=1 Tax=Coprinopsis marcescibilis TaxID=230819 RepID=A0A5C3KUQ7_COPMA|nr:hypothetical protein FA15DRAFT_620133 [Coprinopsis marcescibilis]
MTSRKSPLRERLLSNSPDPIKTSILRESGMGWNAQNTGSVSSTSSSSSSIISPLRISKRDSPSRVKGVVVARRSSSSYKHMHSNNLVSKSPFKSQIPTPTAPSSRPTPIAVVFPATTPTRRVSGEKRPRPVSLHEQEEAENERPFALKRDRKQSKGLQGLLEKEPVSKSPFRTTVRRSPSDRSKSSPPSTRPRPKSELIPQPSHLQTPSQRPPSRGPSPGLSPGRSSLVSRRMHGPRISGSGRRERRKTVTWDERCDVLEFDRDESTEEEALEFEDEDDDGSETSELDNSHEIKLPGLQMEEDDGMEQEDSSDGSISLADEVKKVDNLLDLDPDTSITNIVDEMLTSNELGDNSVALFDTPPRHAGLPADLETEDGVPLGRSHHVERFLQHQQHISPHVQQPPHFSPKDSPQRNSSRGSGLYPFNLNLPTHASPHGPPATPPRRSPGMMHSTPPLGRSSHVERAKHAREEDKSETDGDVKMLPPSPSPMKPSRQSTGADALIPSFEIGNTSNGSVSASHNRSAEIGVDPFEHSRIQDESILEDLEESSAFAGFNSANVSVVESEANLSHLMRPEDSPLPEPKKVTGHTTPNSSPNASFQGRATSPLAHASPVSPFLRSGSPLTRAASPLTRATSPFTISTSPSLRQRISKEDVQRRLLGRRSLTEQPSSSPSASPLAPRQDSPAPPPSQEGLLSPLEEERADRASIMTSMTDFSTETAVVTQAERANVSVGSLIANETIEESAQEQVDPNERLTFDFGIKFGHGLGISSDDDETSMNVSSAGLDSFRESSFATRSGFTERSGLQVGGQDVNMDMNSALDRLINDVAGGRVPVDDSIMTDDSFVSQDSCVSEISLPQPSTSKPKVLERASTDTALLHMGAHDGISSRTVSGSSTSTIPPPVPPKDSIANRLLKQQREARSQDEFGSLPHITQSQLGVGRPSRRRSMSTSDALDMTSRRRGKALLDIEELENDNLLGRIEQELERKMNTQEPPKKTSYQVRERKTTIYASSSDDKVSHMAGAGDLDNGRAWRIVRRPSDMNEYAKQIRDYRAQDKGKAYGKVFVKVVEVKNMHLPLPRDPTAITCTLNNGIHFVSTPECQLGQESRIEQEFELIEHSKLEFTLTIKVKRDPHISAQFQALAAPAPAVPARVVPIPPPIVQTASKSSGRFSLFSSSPKKSKDKVVARPSPVMAPPPTIPQSQHRLPENLARYLKSDGTLGRAFVSFKDIVHRCDTRLFETSFPLIGQRAELGGKFSTQQVGELVLQVFRLPPLPGIPQNELPQSLEECHRGLRHINWHKMTYFQGTLTQNGGDCTTWRRRQFRVIGGNLVAFNDVTKRATATIDLKMAIRVEDDQDCKDSSRFEDLYGVERSFRLVFPDNDEIVFFADTDDEKKRWLDVLKALVGKVPPHPLWAELLWQRQEELTKRAQAARQVVRPYDPMASTESQQR